MPPAATLLALRPRPGHGSKLHVCWNRRPVPKCHRRPHDGGTEQASLRPRPLHGRKSPPPTTAAVSTARPDPGGRGLTPALRAPCPHRRRALCWGPADKQPASRGEGGAGRGGQAGSEGRRKHPGCPATPANRVRGQSEGGRGLRAAGRAISGIRLPVSPRRPSEARPRGPTHSP